MPSDKSSLPIGRSTEELKSRGMAEEAVEVSLMMADKVRLKGMLVGQCKNLEFLRSLRVFLWKKAGRILS